MPAIRVDRLCATDVSVARSLFTTIAQVFETEARALGDNYLMRLVDRAEF